jgi:hypothetical protein
MRFGSLKAWGGDTVYSSAGSFDDKITSIYIIDTRREKIDRTEYQLEYKY